MTEEMLTRATEAETTYKSCVFEANFRQSELEKSKVCTHFLYSLSVCRQSHTHVM